MAQFYGSLMSILQNDDCRIEGVLASINQEASTITLSDVILFGTEDRNAARVVPYISQSFPSLTINRGQVKAMSKLTARTPAPEAPPESQLPAPVQIAAPSFSTTSTNPSTTSTPLTQNQQPTSPNDENRVRNQIGRDNADGDFGFNTQSLDIKRDSDITPTKAYDPSSGFFDATSDHANRPYFSNMDTFGENLKRGRRVNYNASYGGNNHMQQRNNNNNNNNNNYDHGGYRNNNTNGSGYNNNNNRPYNRNNNNNGGYNRSNNNNDNSNRNNNQGGYRRNNQTNEQGRWNNRDD